MLKTNNSAAFLMTTGDDFRYHIAALLVTRYDNVRSQVQLRRKKADICSETRQFEPGSRMTFFAIMVSIIASTLP
jgi:methylthioribose-1-phosphate isomerase